MIEIETSTKGEDPSLLGTHSFKWKKSLKLMDKSCRMSKVTNTEYELTKSIYAKGLLFN